MKTVIADLVIELTVECPDCENNFNLLSPETGLNDEGELIREAISDDRWEIDASERIEVKGVKCPDCKHVFNVKGLNW